MFRSATYIKILSWIFSLCIFPIIISVIGYQQIWPQMQGEFTQHLGSIEVSYIQMAKFIESSWPNFSWQPLWYFGYPMSIVYTPVLPFLEFFSKQLLNWSYSHAYRVITGIGYIASLVSLYFFARTLFKNTWSGLVSALSWGITPSIMAYFYSEIAGDRFSREIIEPRRFTVLVRWGEGPHILSLVFMPLAGLFLVKFLRSGSKWNLLWGSLMTAFTVLTNSVGSWALFILAVSICLGELAEKKGQWWKILLRCGLFAGTSYGISAFWLNPLFFSVFFQEGGGSFGAWRNLFPWGFLGGILGVMLFILIARKIIGVFTGVASSLIFFGIMFFLVNTYYASGMEKLELVPQVLRLTIEVDLAYGLVLGAILAVIDNVISRKNYWMAKAAVCAFAIVFCGWLIPSQLRLAQELPGFSQPLESTGKGLSNTQEYKVAQTLKTKVTGNERVVAPGNYGFYLNYFVEVPQLRGALYQSSIHDWPDHIYYQLANGNDPQIALAWLKIANAGWLVFNGPMEIFQDYKCDVSKFDDVLTLDAEIAGDRYYKVPLKSTSLAKAVPEAIEKVTKPYNAIDSEAIFSYVNLLDSGSGNLSFINTGFNGNYQISGEIFPGNLILVQMAYAPGWTAIDQKNNRLAVKSDPLGFILVKPQIPGEQKIVLNYEKPIQIWIGWMITGATLLGIVGLMIFFKGQLIDFKTDTKAREKEDE